MPEEKNKIACPTCAHEFTLEPDADITRLTCPHCEAEIPEESLRAHVKSEDELTPGFKAGQRLGNYVVESLLGSGGMAVVLGGRQLSLNRKVAVKILPKQLAKNKIFVARFESEAAVLASLNHPNIVSVIDRGREGDTYFIVMEYVEGETLKTRVRRQGIFAPAQVLPIAMQILAGLEYAHRRGVVHRDIKPGNIIINREEMVKIADFGLAHLATAQGGLDVTRDGQTMGTLKYMAPEQLTSAKDIDARADLYSVGVCLYEMLTGKLPLGTFKMPSECDNTADLRWDDVILRALKMEPEERFSSAEKMTQALREIATTPGKSLAQSEREEEAEVRAKSAVSLTACAHCGHESKPAARQCEKCGASLADLFDACPSCKIENRVDTARCPGCGADLAANREQMRREAEEIQAKAKQLAAEPQFDQALAQLNKLARFRTREYAAMRENARVWIERIKRRQERFYQRAYDAGRRLIAEGRAEQALRVWASLPEDYQDVVVRRKDVAAKMLEADAAAAEGNRLDGLGDLAGALAAWEKAAGFRPHDLDLHKRLAAARIRHGNLKLKRSYMQESEEAAARGDVVEALALCRRVLTLDPADQSALSLVKDLEAKNREFVKQEVEAAPKATVPGLRPRSSLPKWLTLRTVGLTVGAVGLIWLVGWILFVAVPASQHATEEAAAGILQEAKDLKDQGKVSAALSKCRLIRTDYSGTPCAEEASQLEKAIKELEADAHARYVEAEALATGKDLASLMLLYSKLQELLKGPPVAAVDIYRDQVEKRVTEIREGIAQAEAQLAAACEKKGEWQRALKHYRVASEDYGCAGEPIASGLARAAKRLQDCAAQVKAGGLAVRAAQWDQAFPHAVAALDLVPTDPAANKLLADIAPKLTPPSGMVLAPPGKYIVGGSEGNPRRTVELPYGCYIDAADVTNARYAEFLRATRRTPPPDWREDGLPPPGAAALPVVNVTWEDAAAFAAWANGTLPTEEQWECACRGPSGRAYPWGESWDAAAAVLGFGPAPAGAAAKDRSPFGCEDMAGNVAEWTATALEPAPVAPDGAATPDSGAVTPRPPSAAAAAATPVLGVGDRGPAQPLMHVVKGSSWAGLEKDRPTTVVGDPLSAGTPAAGAGDKGLSAGPATGGADSPVMLAPDPKSPEWAVRFRSNIEIQYLGIINDGEREFEYILVRRWMPTWDQWAESKFQVTLGQAIGGVVGVVVEEGGPRTRRKTVQVDLSTGCIAVRHELKLYLEIRDPAGVLRTVPYSVAGAPRTPKIAEYKEAPPAPEMSLQQVAGAAARMAGRSNRRYINVGFRCARMLWTPPSDSPAAQESPAK